MSKGIKLIVAAALTAAFATPAAQAESYRSHPGDAFAPRDVMKDVGMKDVYKDVYRHAPGDAFRIVRPHGEKWGRSIGV